MAFFSKQFTPGQLIRLCKISGLTESLDPYGAKITSIEEAKNYNWSMGSYTKFLKCGTVGLVIEEFPMFNSSIIGTRKLVLLIGDELYVVPSSACELYVTGSP